MRQWQTVLERDSTAWKDFLSWLDELEHAELRKFVDSPSIDAPTQRGVVQGIRLVRSRAQLNSLEDAQRARRNAANS